MEMINRRQRMASITRKLRRENKTIGFVPTMGSLHKGHLTIIDEARKMSDVVIVSIFVNPAQFNDQKDFDRYPRDLTADAALLAEYDVDYIFAPDANEIYGENFGTYVYVDELSDPLEGASRPGHFRGVATIVTILFNAIRPDYAFFGQKDAQQLSVIKRLTRDLGFETEIVTVAIVREQSGLAMSSRNELLTADDRAKAAVIYKGLSKAENAFNDGERNASVLSQMVETTINSADDIDIDYIAIIDPDTLQHIDIIEDKAALAAVAVKIGGIRLIDNLVLGKLQ